MRILVALDGNALLRRGESTGVDAQRKNVEAAAQGLAAIACEHELVIAHGNGPQVGLLALALRNALPDRDVVTVLTEVVVSPDDPAFLKPSKPIGPVYSAAEVTQLSQGRGWTVERDGGDYRRLAPSPEPNAVVELRSLRVLIDSGALLICAGDGGIPVTIDGTGTMRGVEAVIDMDLTAALLARRLDVDLLLMLADVDAVQLDWGTEKARPLHATTPQELRQLDFASGSMAPKVEAACRFVEATGRRAAVGAPADAEQILRGDAGTQVASRADGSPSA
jgi:carbamate kinase